MTGICARPPDAGLKPSAIGFSDLGGAAPVPILASLVMMWIAWILVLVLVIRAVRQSFPSRRARRWSRALGAMPTTIPWFGFATAQMMVE